MRAIPTKSFRRLADAIIDQLLRALVKAESKGSKYSASGELELEGKYVVDKNGNIVVAFDSDSAQLPISVPLSAKVGTSWERNQTLESLGHVAIRFSVRFSNGECEEVEQRQER